MKCVPLSDLIVSVIPNLVKNSFKNLIVRSFYISSPLAIARNYQLQLINILLSLHLQNQYAALSNVCPSLVKG